MPKIDYKMMREVSTPGTVSQTMLRKYMYSCNKLKRITDRVKAKEELSMELSKYYA